MSATKKLQTETCQHVRDAVHMEVTDRLSAMVKMNVVLWNTHELLNSFLWVREATAVADAFTDVRGLKEIIKCLVASLESVHNAWDLVTAHLQEVAPGTLEAVARHGEPDGRIHT